MQIESVAQDGMINIENVSYFKNRELADGKTAELDWAKRYLYAGPPFGNLDEDLQVLLERYLEERGIDTALALFVPDYVDFKEQREYLSWLSSKSYWQHLVKNDAYPLSRPEVIRGCLKIRCLASSYIYAQNLIFTPRAHQIRCVLYRTARQL